MGCLIFIVGGGGGGVFDWNHWGKGVVLEGSEWEQSGLRGLEVGCHLHACNACDQQIFSVATRKCDRDVLAHRKLKHKHMNKRFKLKHIHIGKVWLFRFA